MNCPNCDKKPVGAFGTIIPFQAGFKKAFKGFTKCKHCDALLTQQRNELGIPQFEKPFWIVYSLFMVGLIGSVWGIFAYLESTIGSQSLWITIPLIVAVLILLFFIMDWLRARYWILKETTIEKHEQEIKSQKLSTKGVIAFIFFAIATIASFLYLDVLVENLSLSPTAYSLSAIVYMMIIMLMAFGLMQYLSKSQPQDSE